MGLSALRWSVEWKRALPGRRPKIGAGTEGRAQCAGCLPGIGPGLGAFEKLPKGHTTFAASDKNKTPSASVLRANVRQCQLNLKLP